MSASHKCSLQLSLRWEYTGIQRNHNEIKATIRRALHITSKEKKEHINGMEWNAWCKFLCWLCCLIKTTLCFCHFIVQCARVSSDHGNSRWITNLINLLWVQVDCISLTHTGTYVIFANLIFFKSERKLNWQDAETQRQFESFCTIPVILHVDEFIDGQTARVRFPNHLGRFQMQVSISSNCYLSAICGGNAMKFPW